jgi:hypothetical protein
VCRPRAASIPNLGVTVCDRIQEDEATQTHALAESRL